jgi:hypothetical protein
LINRQLEVLGVEDDPLDFAVIQLLKDNWMRLDNPDVVTGIFHEHFYPFLNHLYEGAIPEADKSVYLKLHQAAYLLSRRNMTQAALDFRQEMIQQGLINENDERALPVIACDKYLEAGIDHVLVGMRSVKYVESLKSLF